MIERELLDIILESNELFERYTSIQDALGMFLNNEKERRENAKISYDTAVKAEQIRQSEAFNKIVRMANSNKVGLTVVANELNNEQELREKIAKDIIEIANLEAEKRSNAARTFGKLIIERHSLDEACCSSDFQRRYRPNI